MINKRIYYLLDVSIAFTAFCVFYIGFLIFILLFGAYYIFLIIYFLIFLILLISIIILWVLCLTSYIFITDLDITKVFLRRKTTILHSEIKHIALIRDRYFHITIIFPKDYPESKMSYFLKSGNLEKAYNDKRLIIFLEKRRIKKALEEHGYVIDLKVR